MKTAKYILLFLMSIQAFAIDYDVPDFIKDKIKDPLNNKYTCFDSTNNRNLIFTVDINKGLAKVENLGEKIIDKNGNFKKYDFTKGSAIGSISIRSDLRISKKSGQEVLLSVTLIASAYYNRAVSYSLDFVKYSNTNELKIFFGQLNCTYEDR